MTVRTTESKDAAKGTRGPSVQTQWVYACNNHVRKRGRICLKMRQRSYNDQVLRRGCGVHAVPSSDAAMCATFKDMAVRTAVSKDRPRVPKEQERLIILMRLVRVGRQSCLGAPEERKGQVHNRIPRRSQRSKRFIQTWSVGGGCGGILSSDAEVGWPSAGWRNFVLLCKQCFGHAFPCDYRNALDVTAKC